MLNYRESGSGPVLVFLHGFCEDIRIWDNYLPLFAPGYRVICLDLPGFGKSPVAEPDLSVWARECLATLDSLNVDGFSLIGHSMGGYVALALAELAPRRIRTLTLFHSSAYADTEEKKENRLKQVRFTEEHGAKKMVQQLVPKLFREGYSGDGLSYAIGIAEEQTKEGIVAALIAMKDRSDRTAVLKEAMFPVLFLSGKHDTLLPLADQATQASMPSVCQFSILDSSGHMGMLEEPEQAHRHMRHFFETFIKE